MNYAAYLIVVCDNATNAVLGAEIWSSPEWEQSRCLEQRTYVAYAVGGFNFHEARNGILEAISDSRSRYHWLLPHLPHQDRLRASTSF